MSKFKIQTNDDLDLRIVQVTENVTYKDLISLAKREFGSHIKRNLIWEFQPGTLQLLNVEDIKLNLDVRRREHELREGGHTIMVTHDLSEQLLVKWYQTFAESIEFHSVQFHVCDSLEEAMNIVRGVPNPPTRPENS